MWMTCSTASLLLLAAPRRTRITMVELDPPLHHRGHGITGFITASTKKPTRGPPIATNANNQKRLSQWSLCCVLLAERSRHRSEGQAVETGLPVPCRCCGLLRPSLSGECARLATVRRGRRGFRWLRRAGAKVTGGGSRLVMLRIKSRGIGRSPWMRPGGRCFRGFAHGRWSMRHRNHAEGIGCTLNMRKSDHRDRAFRGMAIRNYGAWRSRVSRWRSPISGIAITADQLAEAAR